MAKIKSIEYSDEIFEDSIFNHKLFLNVDIKYRTIK